MRILPKVLPRSGAQRQADLEHQLIQREAEIGGTLFGPVPDGHKRSFFCLDEHTWIWHEELTVNGRRQVITTRYDVRSTEVIKFQNGQVAQRLSPREDKNFRQAVRLYYQKVSADYDRQLQTA
jgi:hypothetical protein